MKPYAVDRERWSKLTIFEQLGNISSEVGRSFSAKRRGDQADSLRAVYRAIDLFDATVDALIKRRSPKSKEVLRAKEEYLKTFFVSDPEPKQIVSLERYFMQFAVAARLQR